MDDCMRVREGAVELRVRLMPRASREAIQGMHGDRLKIRLTAPPVGGAANEALVLFLSRLVRIPRTSIRIVLGARQRSKTVVLESADPAALAARLRARIAAAVDKRGHRN